MSLRYFCLFGSFSLFAMLFLTLLSGRTTTTGTDEWEMQYRETEPIPGADQ